MQSPVSIFGINIDNRVQQPRSKTKQKQQKASSLLKSKGYFKLYIDSINLIELDQEIVNCKVQIAAEIRNTKKVSNQLIITNKTKIQIGQNFIFNAGSEDNLNIWIINKNNNKKYAFTQFPIRKFLSYQRINHIVQIDFLGERQVNKQNLVMKVGELKAQIIFISSKIGILSIKINKIIFKNCKEATSVYIKVNNRYNKSEAKNKRQKFNQIFQTLIIQEILINQIEQLPKMEITLNDNNSNNLLGEVSLNLLKDDYLYPYQQDWVRSISIKNKNQQVGILHIATKFVIDQQSN